MKLAKHIFTLVLVFTSITIQAQKLKVIAYNVEFAKNTTPEEMAAYLKSEKADIICFNEVPAQGWTKEVGKLLGLPYSYEGEIASAHHTEEFKDKTKKYFGKYKSILCKYPLENTNEITIEGSGWSPATAVSATIKINDSTSVRVFSLHIPSGESNPDNSRAYHLAKIIKEQYATTDKIIVAGDFNDVHDSKPMQYFYNAGLQNPWEELKVDLSNQTTYPSGKVNSYVIDHILFKGFEVISTGILKERTKPLSDHSAVRVVFEY
ncbi:endonuclease/exonuclease/phosphatase family protein [Aureibaculum conchae]|uniref:endonuclease/exonuclease/phosphatase family protein n=1 Tax=Aureibaculum sp. 2308TA14-22 TaxID=3108392 RepID=UPI0033956C8B